MVCQQCHDWVIEAVELDKSPRPWNGKLTGTATPSQVRRGAKDGCFICRCVLRANDSASQILHPLTGAEALIMQSTARIGSLLTIPYHDHSTPGSYLFFTFSVAEDSPDVSLYNQPEPTSNGDHPVLSRARVWLEQCTESHKVCATIGANYYPKRLLHILRSGDKTTCRLVHGAEARSIGSGYCTLSYRWGPEVELLMLTHRNEHELQQAIADDDLPNLAREAVQITHALGVRFLWIDSLCLKQDVQDEMRQELITMGLVYQNALCNIAAAAGDPDKIFQDREPYDTNCCQVYVKRQGHNLSQTRLRLVNEGYWSEYVSQSSLLKRGWTYQERLLARRTLFFAEGQIFWECASGRCCELYPEPLPWPDDLFDVNRPAHMYDTDDALLATMHKQLARTGPMAPVRPSHGRSTETLDNSLGHLSLI